MDHREELAGGDRQGFGNQSLADATGSAGDYGN